MNHLSGTGITEVWGAADDSGLGATEASGAPYMVTPLETTVYSNCARLGLYHIDALGGDVVGDPVFSMPVADSTAPVAPGGFGAEVNVGGYAIYGYTLDAMALALAPGFYRVLFSLDDSAAWSGVSVSRNTVITGLDEADSVRDEPSRSAVIMS